MAAHKAAPQADCLKQDRVRLFNRQKIDQYSGGLPVDLDAQVEEY